MPQFRLVAGTHVGPDTKGTTRMWAANGPHNIIDTHQDLNSLNARGFPPKFQPLTAAPQDEASLLKQKADIEAQLEAMRRATVSSPAQAPVIDDGQAPLAPQMPLDPRDALSPEVLIRNAKSSMVQSTLDACAKYDEEELRAFCEGEEIPVEEGATKAEMLTAVQNFYATN